MTLTRRSLAARALAAPALAAFAARGQAPALPPQVQGLRVRRSLTSMAPNDPDLEALRYAIGVMRADDGPLSWDTQRRVHASPWGHHNSWRFLPWHRFQLHYLERIIAKISEKPDFAMPYWDWSSDHAPAVYFQRRSPLYDETRTITPASRMSRYLGFEWGDGASDDFWARTDNDFGDFFGSQNPTGEMGSGYAGSAEQYGHNLVHLFVGGRMRDLLISPLDPLFWAHHSNVDRQWALWTEIHGAGNYPRAFGAEPCTGYVDADGYLAPARSAAECVDTRRLGYTFDDLAVAGRALQSEQWPGQRDPRAPSVAQQTLQMQRVGVGAVRVFVPPQLLSNLAGANGPLLDVKGFLQVAGMDGYVVRLSSRSIDGGFVFGQDAIFSVPMGGGGMGMTPMGHRVQLRRMVPRDPRALAEGFWIEAQADLLRGEQEGMAPNVANFTLDFRSQVI